MRRLTDPFRSKYNIGQTIHPEKQNGLETRVGTTYDDDHDLYASDLDEDDAAFVSETFGVTKGSSDGVLCCPGCFTPICYNCKINASGHFQSAEAVNVSVDLATMIGMGDGAEASSDNGMTVKRPMAGEQSDQQSHVARCDECQNVVAFVDDDGTYHFRRVIASQP